MVTVMTPQLTLYGYVCSPQAEKIELALKESNIPYKYYSVDIFNKPAFFAERINPFSKVPTIAYGGPDVHPEEPSPLSFKLAESNVILEFLAEAYPEAKLMPTDITQRAKVRFFIEVVTRKYFPACVAWILNTEPNATESLLEAIEFIQGLLSDTKGYAVGGGYTIADACITPYISRLLLVIEYDIGKFPAGHGPKFGEMLKDPKYAKFMEYASAVTERPVTKENWVPKKEGVKKVWTDTLSRESTFKLTPELTQARG